ncbi:hypothetical protein FVEG_16980 [Fusarium verticillioides 7600]|uniref:Uncharacterized protein n=1 Tax=Gibberella moniliformis (strain M3125 / FGSC 7600) TaxID=334819 RepID=W7MXA5_GIBM7|nr:hypothetical protein FVEG_16980 [Fusarium verticillioides 7600]EWG52449.1 hypothetical protein FVEG_16980 [Fusarium verticillioides 7600]
MGTNALGKVVLYDGMLRCRKLSDQPGAPSLTQVRFPGYLNEFERGEHRDPQDRRVSFKSRLEAVFVIEEHARAKYSSMKTRFFGLAYANEGNFLLQSVYDRGPR